MSPLIPVYPVGPVSPIGPCLPTAPDRLTPQEEYVLFPDFFYNL